jgi:type VI secretion system protein ImpC
VSETVFTERVDRVIADIDARIAELIDSVLHHPAFQALEAAWRGLRFVVDRVDFGENTLVEVWACSKGQLQADLLAAVDVTSSALFLTIYTAEYGQFGGQPYGAVFVDASLTGAPADVELLRRLAAVAAMAHAPTFLAADPKLFGVSSFDELAYVTNLEAAFEGPGKIQWNAFRQTEDSRYIGILLPRTLMRVPYREPAHTSASFVYEEQIAHSADYLWGSATYAFAVRLADSFAQSRTYVGLVGAHEDIPAALDTHPSLGSSHKKPPVEIVLSRRLEQGLSELGFMPVTVDPFRSTLRLTTANSLQQPKTFGSSDGGASATLNFLLGTRLPYLLLACRFAHYLKVLERERVGVQQTRDEIERQLNEWLLQYVVVMDSASAATRIKYPLRNGRVKLRDDEGNPGWYRMEVLIQPHLKYMRHALTLSVAGWTERRA